MKTPKKIFVVIAFLNLMLLTIPTAAQSGGKTDKSQIKLPALLMPDPKIEWKKYEENVKRGGKTMKAAITLTFTNWDKYGESLFKPLDAKPTCDDPATDSRMILELFDVQTDKGVFTDCAVDAGRLKSETFYVLPENQVPVCVYAVLTDRQTGRKVKSNWMNVKGGKVCFKNAPDGSVTVVTPKS